MALAPEPAIRPAVPAGISRRMALAARQGCYPHPAWLQSFNGLEGQVPQWKPSEWRKDTRIELIFEHAQPASPLQVALAQCLIT